MLAPESTVNSPWDKLNYEVSKLQRKQPYLPEWQLIEEKPITPESIDQLFSDGLIVQPTAFSKYGRITYKNAGVISINPRLTPYLRDITVCHEIAHAHYPTHEFIDPNNLCKLANLYDELIIEWAGRKARSNPLILRALARNLADDTQHGFFTMKPVIYDRATFLAFGVHDYDLDEVSKECPQPLKNLPLLMDIPN